ncbi:MAG: 16S rRNA (uracil(1498)-N(3))-methyltransferase [Pseudoflavonifractor sp.]|nr:16S rRNA (uracil(1498)-N(3))-methyltransferase [Pseudoflavonifractor sp.]
MIQFYVPDIAQTLRLPESESQHCVRVLRMTPGEEIEIIDGHGMRYRCRLTAAHPKRAEVEIIESLPAPLSWPQTITVAVAPTKHNDRMEWLVEKLTEIGVNRIIPMLCRHSERKEIKRERLEKIAVSAMKQSLKSVLPTIDEMTPVRDIITDVKAAQRYIAYCDPSIPRRLLAREYRPETNTLILIGPEGDFSTDEITVALDAGFVPVSLGDNRLRTETAALVACDTCHIIDQLNIKNQ